MPTILLKKSDTASAVPTTANLTNLAGGVEVAVNTADRRMFTMTSASAVVELGTNPSSLTLTGGAANCVLYLNGSKAVSSTADLVFDGTNLIATRELKAASSGIPVSSFVNGLNVGGYDSIGFAASPGNALAVGGYRAAQWSAVELYTSGTLKAVLDSSGNLGLGVTPSAWTSNIKALEGASGGALSFYATGGFPGTFITSNAYSDGTNWIAKVTDQACLYTLEGTTGKHIWSVAASNTTAGNAITFTQAMTLDASGNLTVANGDITIGTNGKKLYTNYIANNSGVNLNFDAANFLFNTGNVGIGTASPASKLDVRNTGGTYDKGISIQTASAGNIGTIWTSLTDLNIGIAGAHKFTNFDGSATRMTLTSTNNLLVGTTTDVSGRSGVISDISGNVRAIPRTGSAKTSVYTLTVSDVGQFVELGTGGGIDVPNGIFSTGDVVSVFNNTTGNRTISLTITTAYIAGTDADKASVTLATRGVATVLFISNSVCVVNGNVS